MPLLELLGYATVSFSSLLVAYFLGVFTGAHYIPTDPKRVERMLDLVNVTPEDTLVDIGSGDGRIVIAAGKRGVSAIGYELNPVLVYLSLRAVQKAGVESKVQIRWKDFWHADLSPFTVVTVFGIPHIMEMLEGKLERELSPGSRVASNLFRFPNWVGKEENRLFVYGILNEELSVRTR